MTGLRVTHLERATKGHWTATVTVNGASADVDNSNGSWQTVRDENGRTRDVHPWIAAALQERVKIAARKLARAA